MAIKNVTVAGGGVLGSQIAFQTAFKGFNVSMWLRSEGSIERAKPKLQGLKLIYLKTLEDMKSDKTAYCRGLADNPDISDEEIDILKEKVEKIFDNIKLTTDYKEACDDADLVIEAIAEDFNQKVDFYKELSQHLPDKTIIVTNSSTLLPSKLAEYTGRPNKYLSLHFANRIWKNNTAEIMGHPTTEQKYYDEIVQFADDIGMIPLKLKKEQAGYILNSMLVPLLASAQILLANEVADAETIDKTWTLATGAPFGPFRILDGVGLVTAYNINEMDPRSKDPNSVQYKISKILKDKIDQGKTGVSAGEGFYKY